MCVNLCKSKHWNLSWWICKCCSLKTMDELMNIVCLTKLNLDVDGYCLLFWKKITFQGVTLFLAVKIILS